jgi:hypothetical protein
MRLSALPWHPRWALLAAPWLATILFVGAIAAAQAQVRFLTEDPGTKVPIAVAARLAPEGVRPGEIARVQVEVEIGAPWYIYSIRPDPGGGPPTRLVVQDGAVEVLNQIHESPPLEELDLRSGGSVRVHKSRARFWADVRIPEHAKPGPLAVKGTLAYAACNGEICLPLRREAFLAEGRIEPGRSRQDTRAIFPKR